jgi:hypothetical protein
VRPTKAQLGRRGGVGLCVRARNSAIALFAAAAVVFPFEVAAAADAEGSGLRRCASPAGLRNFEVFAERRTTSCGFGRHVARWIDRRIRTRGIDYGERFVLRRVRSPATRPPTGFAAGWLRTKSQSTRWLALPPAAQTCCSRSGSSLRAGPRTNYWRDIFRPVRCCTVFVLGRPLPNNRRLAPVVKQYACRAVSASQPPLMGLQC